MPLERQVHEHEVKIRKLEDRIKKLEQYINSKIQKELQEQEKLRIMDEFPLDPQFDM